MASAVEGQKISDKDEVADLMGHLEEDDEYEPAYMSQTDLLASRMDQQGAEIERLTRAVAEKESEREKQQQVLDAGLADVARKDILLMQRVEGVRRLKEQLTFQQVEMNAQSNRLRMQMGEIQSLERFKQMYALQGVESTSILLATPLEDEESERMERDVEDQRRRLRILEEKRLHVMSEGAYVEMCRSDGEPGGRRWKEQVYMKVVRNAVSESFELAYGPTPESLMPGVKTMAGGLAKGLTGGLIGGGVEEKAHFLDLKQAYTVAHGAASTVLQEVIQESLPDGSTPGLMTDPQLCFTVVLRLDSGPKFIDIKVLDRPSLDVWFRGLQTMVHLDDTTPAGFHDPARKTKGKKFSQGKLCWKWFLCKYRFKAECCGEMFHEYVRREVNAKEMLNSGGGASGSQFSATDD